MSDNLKFNVWLSEVDKAVQAIAGVSVHDLPDFPSRDYFDDGMSPSDVAELVLEDEGWEA